MQLLWRVAAAIFLLGAVGIVAIDQAQSREQPVTHLTMPACKAEDLKLLAARRKFSEVPSKTQRVGRWQIVQWPALDLSPYDRDPSADLYDRAFVEIYRIGSHPQKDCQLLVTNPPGGLPDAIVNWERTPLSDEPVPQLILGSYSGGASGCCWTSYIVSLGDTLKVDRTAPTYGDQGATFDEKNPSMQPDITLPDMAFFRWQGAADADWGATAHYTLIWQSDRYALEWPTRSASPSNAELQKWQQEMTDALRIMSIDRRYRSLSDPNRGESNLTLNSIIWQHLLGLIYAGYTDMAVELLNNAWPKDIRGKDLFWQDFRKQLQDYSVIWDARHLDQLLPRHLPAKS